MSVQREGEKHIDRGEGQGTEGQPFEVTVFGKIFAPAINQVQRERNQQERRKHFLRRRKNWTLLFAGTAATAAILVWCETREQVEVAREAMIAQHRAWVLPRLPGKHAFRCAEETGICTLDIVIAMKNFGNSPAINLISKMSWDWDQSKLPKDIPRKAGGVMIPQGGQEGSDAILSKNGVEGIRLTTAQHVEVTESTRKLYIGGIVIYDDPYGANRRVCFCAFYDPKRSIFLFCGSGTDPAWNSQANDDGTCGERQPANLSDNP